MQHAATPESEAAAVAACQAVIERLKAVIEDENQALTAQEIRTHASFAGRKNQLLRELMSAQRGCYSPAALRAIAQACSGLKRSLAHNETLLRNHIAALGEVSAIIIDSIKQAESDGTYSHQVVRMRRS